MEVERVPSLFLCVQEGNDRVCYTVARGVLAGQSVEGKVVRTEGLVLKPGQGGVVAAFVQDVRKVSLVLIEIEFKGRRADTDHPVAVRISPRKEGGARRAALGRGAVESIKTDTLRGEAVEVGSARLGNSVAPEVLADVV